MTLWKVNPVDRKSILGFIMIALVIILYPWYMNIVAPIDKTTPLDNYEDQIISDNKKEIINYDIHKRLLISED